MKLNNVSNKKRLEHQIEIGDILLNKKIFYISISQLDTLINKDIEYQNNC